jgi:hypothetical protein
MLHLFFLPILKNRLKKIFESPKKLLC